MKNKLIVFIIILFILILGVSFYMRNIYTPIAIIKTAVKESSLSGESYILCQRARTTGFDWRVIQNEYGDIVNELCNVIGSNPFAELLLRHEFVMAQNTFVFYVEEKTMKYSEVTNQEEIEYIVTGWDILYPVKHDVIFNFFSPKGYITKNDLSPSKTPSMEISGI